MPPATSTGVSNSWVARGTRWRQAQAEVARAGAELLETAAEAGIDWSGADNADDGGLSERSLARVTAREDDVAVLRAALFVAGPRRGGTATAPRPTSSGWCNGMRSPRRQCSPPPTPRRRRGRR